MKSLSLAKPHLIVMVGVPGAGKSFFAERFSHTFSVPLVSWKAIRRELFDNPHFDANEDILVDRVAHHMLSELFKTGAVVVYEADIQSEDHREEVADQAKKAGYETLFVWVQIDAGTAKSRAAKSGLRPTQYQRYEKSFAPFKQSDTPVVISGKHTYASQLKIVLTKLSMPRARRASTPNRPAGRSVTIR